MMAWNVTSLFGATMTRMKFDWHNAPYLVMSGKEKNLQYKLWHVLVFRYGFFSVHWVLFNTETASNRRLIGSCTQSFHFIWKWMTLRSIHPYILMHSYFNWKNKDCNLANVSYSVLRYRINRSMSVCLVISLYFQSLTGKMLVWSPKKCSMIETP